MFTGISLLKDAIRPGGLKKEIVASIFYQFFTNVVGLLVVPLSLGYMTNEKYGIWVTASVMVNWLLNMNFGLGFGLQNKVTEAIAKGQVQQARIYISVVYKYSLIIGITIFSIGMIAVNFIDFSKLYNSALPQDQLRDITIITFSCFCTYFIFSNFAPVLTALKKTSVTKLLGLATNICTVLFLYVVSKFSNDNIVLASVSLSLPLPLIYIVGTFVFFSKNKELSPILSIKNTKVFKEIFTVGGKFLVMQLTSLVMFFTGAVIITQFIGPEEVTPFSVVSRFFAFPLFLFSLGIAPMWPAFTEAYTRKEYDWIRSIIKKLLLISCFACVATFIFFIAGFYLIPIWSRNSFDINSYKLMMLLYMLLTMVMFFSSVVSTFLNALSILNLQVIIQVIAAVLYLLLSIGLIKFTHIGGASVVAGTLASILFYTILCGRVMFNRLKSLQSGAAITSNL